MYRTGTNPAHLVAHLAEIDRLADERLEWYLRGFLSGDPNDWASSSNRACSHAALAMVAEGVPIRQVARVIARLQHATGAEV